MQDTAQHFDAADPNAQLQTAADAFKAFDNPVANRPRDESGRFAPAAQEVADEAEEIDVEDEAELAEAEADEPDEVAETEAEEPAHPMPPSWRSEDAELWEALPADAQAKIAEREAERDRGLNLKLQESANARKEAALAAQEAQTKLNEHIRALETVEALYSVSEPDPRDYGYGTQQYNAAAYNAALAEYHQTSRVLAQFKEQREALSKQAQEAEAKAFTEWKQQHEAQFAPKLLADVPELQDTAKAEPLLRELVTYAIDNGIPEDVFAEEMQQQITSAQLHLLWKAQQYDKLKGSNAAPKPKASPPVRPGVSSTRSSQKAVRARNAADRLAREGSIEAGAAIWKQIL